MFIEWYTICITHTSIHEKMLFLKNMKTNELVLKKKISESL